MDPTAIMDVSEKRKIPALATDQNEIPWLSGYSLVTTVDYCLRYHVPFAILLLAAN